MVLCRPSSFVRFGPAVLVTLLSSGALVAQLTPIGLSEVRGQWFINEQMGGQDRFGEALATGDFNGDGAEDLATGVPWDDEPTGGLVNVIDLFVEDCGGRRLWQNLT